jgi:hypothetical protein
VLPSPITATFLDSPAKASPAVSVWQLGLAAENSLPFHAPFAHIVAGLGRFSFPWAADLGDLFHGWGLSQMNVRMLSPLDAVQYRHVMLHAYRHAADAFTSTLQERAAEPLSWWANRLGMEILEITSPWEMESGK